MSTGAECYFTEVSPGKWTYWLQDYPYGSNEDGQTYGPFPSWVDAQTHLDRNHANPGGWSSNCLPDGQHVHEWRKVEDWNAVIGYTVSVRVESLGADATPEALIAYVRTLDPTHPAWRVNANYGRGGMVTKCASCGKKKP